MDDLKFYKFRAPQGMFRVFIVDTAGQLFHLKDTKETKRQDFQSKEEAITFIREEQEKLDLTQRSIDDIDWWVFDDQRNKIFEDNARWRSG